MKKVKTITINTTYSDGEDESLRQSIDRKKRHPSVSKTILDSVDPQKGAWIRIFTKQKFVFFLKISGIYDELKGQEIEELTGIKQSSLRSASSRLDKIIEKGLPTKKMELENLAKDFYLFLDLIEERLPFKLPDRQKTNIKNWSIKK